MAGMTASRAALIGLRLLILASVVVLASCGGGDDEKKVDPLAPPADSSAAFKEGYAKGCPAGTDAAAKQGGNWAGAKVDERYGRDLDYKSGWDKGYFTCYDHARHGSFFSGLDIF